VDERSKLIQEKAALQNKETAFKQDEVASKSSSTPRPSGNGG